MPAEALPPIADGLAAAFTNALHPVSVEIFIDPVTLDRLFCLHFEDHEPISLRLSAIELPVILANLAATVTRSLN